MPNNNKFENTASNSYTVEVKLLVLIAAVIETCIEGYRFIFGIGWRAASSRVDRKCSVLTATDLLPPKENISIRLAPGQAVKETILSLIQT